MGMKPTEACWIGWKNITSISALIYERCSLLHGAIGRNKEAVPVHDFSVFASILHIDDDGLAGFEPEKRTRYLCVVRDRLNKMAGETSSEYGAISIV